MTRARIRDDKQACIGTTNGRNGGTRNLVCDNSVMLGKNSISGQRSADVLIYSHYLLLYYSSAYLILDNPWL